MVMSNPSGRLAAPARRSSSVAAIDADALAAMLIDTFYRESLMAEVCAALEVLHVDICTSHIVLRMLDCESS
ncbi:hypothetical protein FQK02_02815 [Xanthomonas vasicola]|nr:hypothetical protein [Xanthomonas vasicola]AZR29624.1 hypothetical protein KWO_002710 [Xanthomonas vasicola pv. musacearum NCPPB 4379]RRJ41135.1 hypothetical protein EIM46_09200 [Xanthomonas vasicola pv. musacearum]RRJ61465.1 hypothetical protein EIM45_10475 [Xanthomonas vasicola pv. musacearum]TWQ07906.1 hypothetical protein FQK02_02815 [Xanthomonas vasicola]